jgi:hypothetical protein
MVEAANAGKTGDPGAGRRPGFGGPACRRVSDRGMDAFGVVVLDILSQEASQVVLAEDDDVIEKLVAHAAHESLRCSVLPWALERSLHR